MPYRPMPMPGPQTRDAGELPQHRPPTYQEKLDEAIDETFPASDPISPSGPDRPEHATRTPRDDVDWVRDEPGKR